MITEQRTGIVAASLWPPVKGHDNQTRRDETASEGHDNLDELFRL
jgi:hypothetical protein